MTKRRFVLIDRDGTLNIEKHYLCDPAQLELTSGAALAVARLNHLGFGVAVVTNQSGLARGYFGWEALRAVHERLTALLAQDHARLDGIYICPHGPEDACRCRKPLPGLVEQAMRDHDFDPTQAIVIGDKAADIDLGRAVGAATILVRTGYGRTTEQQGTAKPDYIADDLAQAVAWIVNRETIPAS